MGKDGKRKVKETADAPTEDKKVPGKRKKPSAASADEIEDLFAAAKVAQKRKERWSKGSAAGKNSEGDARKPRIQIKGSKHDIFGSEPNKVRRVTEEGYRIFEEDELRIDKGGNTKLCPFDCDCCF